MSSRDSVARRRTRDQDPLSTARLAYPRMRVGVLLAVLALAASAAAAKTPLPGIRTPSGNISCFYVPGSPPVLHCQIKQASYVKKLVAYCGQPKIGVDWGGFSLGPTAKGGITCTGGVLYSPGTQRLVFVTLPYGKTWSRGVFTCTSRTTGLTCRNRAGHGLFISRESWRAF
jgi:hypothetical protein